LCCPEFGIDFDRIAPLFSRELEDGSLDLPAATSLFSSYSRPFGSAPIGTSETDIEHLHCDQSYLSLMQSSIKEELADDEMSTLILNRVNNE
jgi:hypothetical protein